MGYGGETPALFEIIEGRGSEPCAKSEECDLAKFAVGYGLQTYSAMCCGRPSNRRSSATAR